MMILSSRGILSLDFLINPFGNQGLKNHIYWPIYRISEATETKEATDSRLWKNRRNV